MRLQDYSHTANCVFSLSYHMVLVTKHRRAVLTGPMIDAARDLARLRCDARGGRLVEFGAEADHIRLMLQLPPSVPVSDLANAIKTNISRRLRRDFPALRRLGDALWSPSYFVTSCGGAGPETVRDYVRAQERTD